MLCHVPCYLLPKVTINMLYKFAKHAKDAEAPSEDSVSRDEAASEVKFLIDAARRRKEYARLNFAYVIAEFFGWWVAWLLLGEAPYVPCCCSLGLRSPGRSAEASAHMNTTCPRPAIPRLEVIRAEITFIADPGCERIRKV